MVPCPSRARDEAVRGVYFTDSAPSDGLVHYKLEVLCITDVTSLIPLEACHPGWKPVS